MRNAWIHPSKPSTLLEKSTVLEALPFLTMRPFRSLSTAGFSNQQALLALLIVFPIGMIGVGLVAMVAMRPNLSSTAQAPRPANQTPASSAPPAQGSPEPSRQTTSSSAPPAQDAPSATTPTTSTPTKPLANQGSANQRVDENNCWFQMRSGGQLTGNRCSVTQRINVNGDRVFDVIEPSGLKRAVVLWENDEVEVFLEGKRYTGNWIVDDDGDVRVNLPGGTFAFTPAR